MISLLRLESKGPGKRGLTRAQVQSIQRAVLKEVLEDLYNRAFEGWPAGARRGAHGGLAAGTVLQGAGGGDALMMSFVNVCVLAVDHILWLEPVASVPAAVAGSPNAALGSPSAAVPAPARPGDHEEYRFVQVVFNTLRGERAPGGGQGTQPAQGVLLRQSTHAERDSSVVDFLPFFATQMAMQSQLVGVQRGRPACSTGRLCSLRASVFPPPRAG